MSEVPLYPVAAVERMWHTQDSQGQILVLAKVIKTFKLHFFKLLQYFKVFSLQDPAVLRARDPAYFLLYYSQA